MRSIGLHGDPSIKKLFLFCLENFGATKLGSNAVITAPGMYRELGEQQRKNSVKFAACNSATLRSYDHKTKKITSIKSTSIQV